MADLNAALLSHLPSFQQMGSVDVAVLVDGQAALTGWWRHGEQVLHAAPPALIYSVTKPLISTLVLMLMAEDRLTLDQEVSSVLPQVLLPVSVTLRHLLMHTSGLPDYGADPAYTQALRERPHQPWTSEDFLSKALARPWLFPPGTGFAYSNPGYLLLKQVIETCTGQTLRDTMQARLFAPLGLTRTAVIETLEEMQTLAPGFSPFWSLGQLQDVRPIYHPGWVSHGVVAAPALELARLLDAVFQGRFFGPALLQAMWAGRPVGLSEHPVFEPPSYGLGVMTDGHQWIGHGGGGPGYGAGVAHAKKLSGQRITSVVLVHGEQGEATLQGAARLAQHAATSDRDSTPS